MEAYDLLVYILAYIGILATTFYIINLFTYYRKKQKPEESTEKKVTIIIPAHNEEESIARTIESALSIDYPKEKLEILIVDDGSKDETYKIAKKFVSSKNPKVKVFTKLNGGKGTALNLGIKNSSGEIIVTMDADTAVEKEALKRMVGYFSNQRVMCVSPSMGIYKPKNFWHRIQQIEYHMGVFLRKSFASMNAIHVTPGAFSAYRKTFFIKHKGFEEKNLTEDLEMALRIQSENYVIENAPDAVAYTIAPNNFKSMLYQRRRWYVGLVKNLWDYKDLFGIKKGPLGAIVLPAAVTTIFLSIAVTLFTLTRTLINVKDELIQLRAVNFQFYNVLELNSFVFENFFIRIFSNTVFFITILFIILLWFYILFSRRKMNYNEKMRFNFLLYISLYGFLFAFWWIISFAYVLFNKKVVWKNTKND